MSDMKNGVWDLGIRWNEYDMVMHGHAMATQERDGKGVTDVWIMESMRRYGIDEQGWMVDDE